MLLPNILVTDKFLSDYKMKARDKDAGYVAKNLRTQETSTCR
jgi:hypothetical protein